MEILAMGKVVVSARIENLSDLIRTNAGDIPSDQVRGVEVDDALVDTGATLLSLPTDMSLPWASNGSEHELLERLLAFSHLVSTRRSV